MHQPVSQHRQDTLRRLLVRLGREHPYHTLYHLLALKHGNYNKHGRPGSADRAEGGMLHTVDAEKVAAAGSTLAAIRADPSRCVPAKHNMDQCSISARPASWLAPQHHALCRSPPRNPCSSSGSHADGEHSSIGCCARAGPQSWTRSAAWRRSTSSSLRSHRRRAPPHNVAVVTADTEPSVATVSRLAAKAANRCYGFVQLLLRVC